MSQHHRRDDDEPDTAPLVAAGAGTFVVDRAEPPTPWGLPRWLVLSLIIWGAILITLCTFWILGSVAPPRTAGTNPAPATGTCVVTPSPAASADPGVGQYGLGGYGFQPGG